MKQFLEGSWAMSEAARLCRPGVVSAYPITPQTHIVEHMAEFVANGKLDAIAINVESEHSAASAVLGSEAVGVRSFTATSSQGLFLMQEVVFNIAGMRLPILMVCANRAISAPINIWNDQQDSIALRDAGWIQIYAENNQEAVDMIIAGYKIGENPKLMLPVMVCVDGFILTHGMETIDMPDQEQVDKFLPKYNPPYKLDVENPMSFGLLCDPSVYIENRYALHMSLEESLPVIEAVGKDFKAAFGRDSVRLVEGYMLEDAEVALVALGSVCGTIKDVVDSERAKGKKVGLLKIVTYRPFPREAVKKALNKIPTIAVLDKNISLGAEGAVYTEVKALMGGCNKKTSGFVAGLGGRDITEKTILDIIELAKKEENNCKFMDLNEKLLWEEFHVS
jgi:pyruvate ferredoxin oxidoreductase alpha subunit